VSIINGYQPNPCDAFAVSTYAYRRGQFSPAEGLKLGGDGVFRLGYDGTGLDLLACDPSGKVNLIPTSVSAAEGGGSHSYRVCLSELPNAEVAVAALPDAQAVATLHNDDAQAGVSTGDPSVAEGDGGAVVLSFPVSLSNPSSQALGVEYASGDGSALAGSDYLAASGALSFEPLETSKTISVVVQGGTIADAQGGHHPQPGRGHRRRSALRLGHRRPRWRPT